MNLFEKIRAAKFAIGFAKHFPKVAIGAAICGVLYAGYHFMQNQEEQLKALQTTVVELKTQNQAIADANKAIDADMKTIKKGVEDFTGHIAQINQNTKSLETKLQTPKFQKELIEDTPKAQEDFNDFFNSYQDEINNETHNY